MASSEKKFTPRLWLFWLLLGAFFVWDWYHAEPINLRLEPSIIAIGSGKAPSGGHCASFGD
mgnify:CR=1 FL=1